MTRVYKVNGLITLLLLFFILSSESVTRGQAPFNKDASAPLSGNPPIVIPLGKEKKVSKKKNQKRGAVLLDARPFFEYSMGHIEKAQPVRAEDYSQAEPGMKGLLDPDEMHLASKLRALGISPKREVIILGKGMEGQGEEGRMAWMLLYLGVTQIKIAEEKTFSGHRTTESAKEEWAEPVWKPQLNEKIRIKKSELKKLIEDKSTDYTLVDVRTAEEYGKAHLPGAIHIEWKSFLKADVLSLLKKNNIPTKNKIIFYCTEGMRSGYPTFLTIKAGLDGRHFDGGYAQWQINP